MCYIIKFQADISQHPYPKYIARIHRLCLSVLQTIYNSREKRTFVMKNMLNFKNFTADELMDILNLALDMKKNPDIRMLFL